MFEKAQTPKIIPSIIVRTIYFFLAIFLILSGIFFSQTGLLMPDNTGGVLAFPVGTFHILFGSALIIFGGLILFLTVQKKEISNIIGISFGVLLFCLSLGSLGVLPQSIYTDYLYIIWTIRILLILGILKLLISARR